MSLPYIDKTDMQYILDKIKTYMDKKLSTDTEFVISQTTLSFTNKVCRVSDSRITANSLVDVYFTSDTIDNAKAAEIIVESVAGAAVLTAANEPMGTIKAAMKVRVV